MVGLVEIAIIEKSSREWENNCEKAIKKLNKVEMQQSTLYFIFLNWTKST